MGTIRSLFASLVIALALAAAAGAATVRIPLVANTAPLLDPTRPTRWFTEVRIWNRNPIAVAARISDVIGAGNPTRTDFVVPAGGVLDLDGSDFFDTATPNADRIVMALVELTSPLPLDVSATVNVDYHNDQGCVGSLGPPPPFVYMSGTCHPTGGPVMRGFGDYFPPNVPVGLGWLTADPLFRNKLYIVNPNSAALSVRAVFRSADGEAVVSRTYDLAPRSLAIVAPLFDRADPAFHPLIRANSKDPASPQAAVTAILSGDRPFYAFAAVLDDGAVSGPEGVRFAIVQPEPAP
jgi:hypothetical protein